tara:strand:+ start:2061 stop:2870 length:810 start_codon:yes stop_codon:yes gene_type:complete
MEFIGEIIKKKRIAKKISIHKVSSELKIPISTLEKIENDEIDEYIDRVYYLGHIRSYSNFLELDSNYVIEQFKLQHAFNKVVVNESIERPTILNPFNYTKYISFAFILIIFVIFYNLFVDVEKPNNEYAIIPDIPENFEPIVEKEILNQNIINLEQTEKDQIKNVLDTEINSSSAIASLPNKDLKANTLITLKFLNPTWIQIRDSDENIILSQLMNAKDEFIYETKEQYTITAGNAGNILVLIDKEVRGKIGNFGDVVDSIIIDSDFNN